MSAPNADFFLPLGFFVEREFLDRSTANELIEELRASPSAPAMVGYDSFRVDERVRKTGDVRLSSLRAREFRNRLAGARGRLARHFNVTLTGFEDPKFLVYGERDFFREHEDSLSGHGLPPRQVSVLIFLNGADAYRGGELRFYGLFDDPGWRRLGFRLSGEPGLLVAFRPDLRHEVTPVGSGTRFTIATWFY